MCLGPKTIKSHVPYLGAFRVRLKMPRLKGPNLVLQMNK